MEKRKRKQMNIKEKRKQREERSKAERKRRAIENTHITIIKKRKKTR